MEIKDLLKARRLEKNLTLDEVAHMVGVSAPTISRWESGDIANMRRDKIVKLAQALDMSPAVIMGWDNEKSENTENNTVDYMIHSLTSDESWFVEHYRSSDEQTKEMVKRLLSYKDVTDNHNHS